MSELTCRDVVSFLMDYVDGVLKPAERRQFEVHLADCDDCVVYMRQYEETTALGKAAFDDPEAPASRHAPAALIEAILAARRTRR